MRGGWETSGREGHFVKKVMEEAHSWVQTNQGLEKKLNPSESEFCTLMRPSNRKKTYNAIYAYIYMHIYTYTDSNEKANYKSTLSNLRENLTLSIHSSQNKCLQLPSRPHRRGCCPRPDWGTDIPRLGLDTLVELCQCSWQFYKYCEEHLTKQLNPRSML